MGRCNETQIAIQRKFVMKYPFIEIIVYVNRKYNYRLEMVQIQYLAILDDLDVEDLRAQALCIAYWTLNLQYKFCYLMPTLTSFCLLFIHLLFLFILHFQRPWSFARLAWTRGLACVQQIGLLQWNISRPSEVDDSTAAAGPECRSPTGCASWTIWSPSKTGTGYPSSSEYCSSYVCWCTKSTSV